MNKNAVAFIASLVALFAGYFYLNYYFATKDKASQPPISAVSPAALATPQAPPVPIASSEAQTANVPVAPVESPLTIASPSDLVIELPYGTARFSEKGGCIGSLQLINYRAASQGTGLVDVFDGYADCRAYGMRLGGEDLRKEPVGVTRTGPKSIRLVQRKAGAEITRDWNFDFKDYTANLRLEVVNRGTSTLTTNLGLELGATSEHKDAGGIFSGNPIEYRNVAYHEDDKVTREHLTFESTPALETIYQRGAFLPMWVASENIYFIAALLPQSRDAFDLVIQRTGFNIQRSAGSPDIKTLYDAWLDTAVSLAPGQSKVLDFKVYAGPKQRDILSTFADRKLEEAVDYGFFRIVALPMYHAIAWLHQHLGNWGVAIIILTLAIKLLFYPLMVKAYLAGKKMQKIQPKMTEIRETWKDDKARQQQEIMALMSQQGVNPVSGCLPVLPQIPVFFGLNAVLTHTFELRHAPFYGWLQDLSSRDPYFISPILMAGLMYLQQRITPMPSMEPAQQRMMQILPLVFAVFMLSYPSGLVLYIVTNSVVSIVQQMYMMKKYKDA